MRWGSRRLPMPDRRPSGRQKRAVAERAGGRCEYCCSPAAPGARSSLSPDPFAVEHIQPLAEGGPTHLSNLAYSCQGCNNSKYAHTTGLDPTTGEKSRFTIRGGTGGPSTLHGVPTFWSSWAAPRLAARPSPSSSSTAPGSSICAGCCCWQGSTLRQSPRRSHRVTTGG